MPNVIQFDPALKQLLLQTTGNPLGEAVPEDVGSSEVPVVARLIDPGVDVEGLNIISRFGSVVTGRVRLDNLVALRQHSKIASLKASATYGSALAFSIPEIHASAELLREVVPPLDVTGRGVVIGFLDWGCDFAHDNLRNPQGGTRLLYLWDQRGGSQSESPQPFNYGRMFSRAQIDAALAQPDPYLALGYDPAQSDPGGSGTHCTHVMDIAAGNGRALGSSPGVAPEADLICVHLKGNDTRPEDTLGDSVRVLEALRFITDCAGDRPLVINLSLGMTGGPHDGTPLLTQALDSLVSEKPGRMVVMSAGNYFDSNIHSAGQVLLGERTDLHWRNNSNDGLAEMEIWYQGNDRFSIELVDPHDNSLGLIALGDDRVVRNEDKIIASMYHRQHDPNNGDHQVDIFLWPDAPSGIWTTRLYGEEINDGHYHAWIERTRPSTQAHFEPESSNPACTTGTICNGMKTIAVGAYDARLPFYPLAHFSSAGPTRDGRPVPVISAPGVAIRAARSSYPTQAGRIINDLTIKSGTSMAAPHVSGVVALMFEAAGNHRLTAEQTREILMTTARTEPADTQYQRYGAGRVDAVATVKRVRELFQKQEVNDPALTKEIEIDALAVESESELFNTNWLRESTSLFEVAQFVPKHWQHERKGMMNRNLESKYSAEQLASRQLNSNGNFTTDGALQWLLQNAPGVMLQSPIFHPQISENQTESWMAENPVAAIGLGIAVFSLGKSILYGGDFSFSATPANYIHPNTPLNLPFNQTTCEFNISADHPRIGFGTQNFWFTLSFESNGKDIRDAKIGVLRERSSTLTASSFTIAFSPIPYSRPAEDVAEIRFNIQGRWDPIGRGDYAFDGYLNVRADGSFQMFIRSDENRVRHGSFTNVRTTHQQAPIQVTALWDVFFSPNSDRLDDASIREIQTWVQGLLEDVRRQVQSGSLPIVLHSYASTTASVAHNQDLARRRLNSVKQALRDFAGSNTQFTEFNHGELQAHTGDQVETRLERRVRMQVTYYR